EWHSWGAIRLTGCTRARSSKRRGWSARRGVAAWRLALACEKRGSHLRPRIAVRKPALHVPAAVFPARPARPALPVQRVHDVRLVRALEVHRPAAVAGGAGELGH